MTSGSRVRTALMAAVVAAGLAACGGADGDDAGSPASVAGEGPDRPAAGGEDIVVEALPLEAPVVLDPVPDGLLVTSTSDELLPAGGNGCATLYGDPDQVDTLDGPVLLVGSSSGSAHGGPRSGGPGEREVDLGGGATGQVIPDTDRTWVATFGNDHVDFVVGRGIDEDELVAAAEGADFGRSTLAPDAVPDGLEPLVAGCPGDGPGGLGSGMTLQGSAARWTTVSAVRADPRLAALWGFWLTDSTGTLVRGMPGSAGALTGTGGDGQDVRGRVWAEGGMVLSAVMFGGDDVLLDQVVQNLRVGTGDEAEVLEEEIRNRPPTRAEAPCPPDGGFVSGVEGANRWVFQLQPNPVSSIEEWSVCYFNVPQSGGGGSVIPPPLGELAVQGFGSGIVGGVAPPGTARVAVTAADGSTLDAQLADVGPRPGERVWGTFIPLMPPPGGVAPFTVTAYDVAGAVLDSEVR